MSTGDLILGPIPASDRRRELWLQHAAGFILFRDVRGYAVEKLDPGLDEAARSAALKAIDDAVYGLMMVLDGVTGGLGNSEYLVHLQTKVRLQEGRTGSRQVIDTVDLSQGDGMCMGYHAWIQDDFGQDPVAVPG